MKTFIITSTLLLFTAFSLRAADLDSVIVQFGNGARMVIHAKDKKALEAIKKYDLNQIFRDTQTRFSTMFAKDTTIILNEQLGQKYLRDTLLVITKDAGRVEIRMKEPNQQSSYSQKSGTSSGTDVQFKNGGIYVKDGQDRVYVGTQGVHVEDGTDEVHIGSGNPLDSADNSSRKSKKSYKQYFGGESRKGFNLCFGLNAFTNDRTTLNYRTTDYDLSTLGSRFVSLGWVRSANLTKGKNSRLAVDFGVDFSWYNFMFEGNNVAKMSDATQRVEFPVFQRDNTPVNLSKSKLTASFVNFSIMPVVYFSNSPVSYIGVGAYGGYRLNSYTKTKEASGGSKDHITAGFYLNNFRYGASFEVGLRNFPDFFVNYDLNQVFRTNSGPQVNAISFGIRL